MAKGDIVGKAFQRIVNDDPAGFAILQQRMKSKADEVAAELKSAYEVKSRNWLVVTGMEYPCSLEAMQFQAILSGMDQTLFVNKMADLTHTSFGEIMDIILPGLVRLRLLTPKSLPTNEPETPGVNSDLKVTNKAVDSALAFSNYRQPIQWRNLRKAAKLAHSEPTWTNLRKRPNFEAHFQDEPGTGGKSVAISRWLAEQWKLSLPEFEDEPACKS